MTIMPMHNAASLAWKFLVWGLPDEYFTSMKEWAEAFSALDSCIDSRRTVLLLDEISWMGKYDVGFPGELKIALGM